MSDKTYRDSLYEVLVFRVLNKILKAIHADKIGIIQFTFSATSVYCLLMAYNTQIFTYLCLGLGLLAVSISIDLFKTYIACGECVIEYKERKYNSSMLCIGEAGPVLYLNGETAFDNGYDYGIIMCEEIIQLIQRFKTIVRPNVPARILKKIDRNLPESIRAEIRGMFQAIETMYPGKLTYWDILTCQMIPELANIGCTCYVTMESENLLLGRNMDWLPFASAQYTILVHYGNHKYTSLVVPGLIGCVTAWNSEYMLAMNVVGLKRELDYDMLPSTLFNKHIMIQANHTAKAYRIAKECIPAGPYHLTIAYANGAKCYSYYQGPNETTYVRHLCDRAFNLTVLNWTEPNHDNGRYISCTRNKWIEELEKKTTNEKKRLVKILRKCQTFETMHSLIAEFKDGKIFIKLCADNGFAADKFENFDSGDF